MSMIKSLLNFRYILFLLFMTNTHKTSTRPIVITGLIFISLFFITGFAKQGYQQYQQVQLEHSYSQCIQEQMFTHGYNHPFARAICNFNLKTDF